MRLAITWVSTFRRPRWRHADDDLVHAEIAAALDDLLERRDQRFAAVEAEALGAGELDVEELLEAFGLDQLVQDRLLAFRVKEMALSGPSMRSWIQAFSAGSEMCMNSTPSVEQ